MRDTVLHQQWQFLLMSQIHRGVWAIEPQRSISMGTAINKLMNRDWNGMDVTEDLTKARGREPLPVCAIETGGDVFAGTEGYDKAPKGSTAIIPLKGTMLKYGTMCTYGTEEIAAQLLDASQHKNISSLILDIDSGGGAVDAVAPIVQAIRKSIAGGKPVVASVDLSASAAYWASAACSCIVANNEISAEIGSIGVMMSFCDTIPYYEKQGYKFHSIYAPESDWKNETFEKALKGEYDLIKSEELSPLAVGFQNAVKAFRGSKLNLEVPGLLNGRMFLAKNSKDNSLNAKEVGLIDEVGDFDLALKIARDLSKKAMVSAYINS